MKDKFANPWQTLSTKNVYENPWISLREDQVIRPDGAPGIYGVVHFRKAAIGVVALDDEDHTWLVGQYRYTLHRYSWEIPEGGCDEGEQWLTAAQRELREETGLVAARWQQLGIAHLSNSVTDEEAIFFLATDLTQTAADPEGTEQLELLRVPFDEALRMIERGEITDGLSIIALLHCAQFRRRNF